MFVTLTVSFITASFVKYIALELLSLFVAIVVTLGNLKLWFSSVKS